MVSPGVPIKDAKERLRFGRVVEPGCRVRLDREDVVSAVGLPGEHDQIPPRRPRRKIIVIRSQCRHCLAFQVHDPQPLAVLAEAPEYQPIPIGGVRRERIVVGAGRQLLEPAGVCVRGGKGNNLRSLRPAVPYLIEDIHDGEEKGREEGC